MFLLNFIASQMKKLFILRYFKFDFDAKILKMLKEKKERILYKASVSNKQMPANSAAHA